MRLKLTGSNVLVALWVVLTLLAIGVAAHYVWIHKPTPAETAAEDAQTVQGDGWSAPVMSGNGAFSIRFPDGWDVSKDTASDSFMIGGEAQPTVKPGSPAKITSTQFGSDGPVVLFVDVTSGAGTPPQGTASSFTLNEKDNPVQGTKYMYEYPADDTTPAIGNRLKGDRDYTYVFDLGGDKHLEVMYSVYGSDPRNNVETIDTLVRTIQLN